MPSAMCSWQSWPSPPPIGRSPRGISTQPSSSTPTAGVYRLYADFERASGGGLEKVRGWLAKTLDAQPDECWVCEDSGEVLPEWHLFGTMGRFDSVHWERPPKIVRLAAGQRPTYALSHDDLPHNNLPHDNLARENLPPDDPGGAEIGHEDRSDEEARGPRDRGAEDVAAKPATRPARLAMPPDVPRQP